MAPRPLSVLVVEDHPTIARQVVDFLEGLHWHPDHAATGKLAIELATREAYDVILLDLNLPDLDGLDVCRTIKAHAPRNLPVLMLTARDAFEDKARGFRDGADDYLTKPFGAPMPEPVAQHHAKPSRVGVLLMHGTSDKVVAYDGKPGGYLSAQDSYQYWLKQNGIAPGAQATRTIDADPGDGTKVTWQEAGNGQQSVTLATIADGGHTWPAADPFNVGLPIGATTRDIDANETMWQFFSRHRRQ